MDQEGGPTVLDLEEGSEWRFELEDDENIAVRVSAILILNRSGDPERESVQGWGTCSPILAWTKLTKSPRLVYFPLRHLQYIDHLLCYPHQWVRPCFC
jgi:hypothetical protein